jgi:hypothetical protein
MIRFTAVKASKIILSLLFLSIYGAILFHNIAPHTHYNSKSQNSNQVVLLSSHENNHEHNHSHHQHHDENDESSWIDYIIGLLGDAKHTDLGNDHFENFISQSTNLHTSSITKIAIESESFNFKAIASLGPIRKESRIGQPKILYDKYRACSGPLRGPPFIS